MQINKNISKIILLTILISALAIGVFSMVIGKLAFGQTTPRVCTVAHATATVGHQASVRIVEPGVRQWTIVQQPPNATNTVSLRFNASSTAGTGLTLNKDVTGLDAASTTEQFKFGYATDIPTDGYLEAITSTGSSTVHIITCR